MIPLTRLADDQRTLAARKWQEGAKPSKPQQPCDIGLFSDDESADGYYSRGIAVYK